MKEDKHVVIFGASSGALKVAHTLISLGMVVDFFVDNDERKQSSTLEGLPIKKPSDLTNTSTEYRIVIASVYHKEIKEQLLHMGIKKENIILNEELVLEFIDSNLEELSGGIRSNGCTGNRKGKILIELAEGVILGGIEKWCISLAEGLYTRNQEVVLITNKDKADTGQIAKDYVHSFDLSFRRYKEAISELVEEITSQLPCTIFISKINQVFMASYIVKRLFPGQLKIISVLHSDFARTYEQNVFLHDNIDAFLCVSNDVRYNFIKHYPVDSEKVFFKDSPVAYEEAYEKRYSHPTEPIRIGYGGRLEKAQKRADLLIPLIQSLESSKIDYRLDIAGEGSLYEPLREYILQHSLEDKVKLYGALPFAKMNDFWKGCDVFINLSDIEGIGLSMLEAMSAGAVPVVTNTAGAKSFITNDVNGYVNELGDISSITDCIITLNKDRGRLREFGNRSREIIKVRCNMDDYIAYLKRL